MSNFIVGRRWRVIPLMLVFAMASVAIAQNETPSMSEAEVRADFNQRLESMRKRIEAAEKSLAGFKEELARRERDADKLIAARLEELRAQSTESKPSKRPSRKNIGSASLLSTEGWQAWQKQDWRTALTKFQRSIELNDGDANTWNGLGWTQFNIGERDNAIESFERALAIDPKHGAAMNGVGQTMIAMGRLDDAEDRLRRATETLIEEHGEAVVVTSGLTASWFGLVNVYIQKGQPKEALQWIKRFEKHSSDDPQFQMLRKQAESIAKS